MQYSLDVIYVVGGGWITEVEAVRRDGRLFFGVESARMRTRALAAHSDEISQMMPAHEQCVSRRLIRRTIVVH